MCADRKKYEGGPERGCSGQPQGTASVQVSPWRALVPVGFWKKIEGKGKSTGITKES